MAQYPAMPLWTDAYLADTKHLSTIEHGAYFLLLVTMWRAPGNKLPNDADLLARFCGLTRGQWKRISPVLMRFFDIDGDYITQGRLTDEAMFVRRKSRSQVNNAKSRWLKNKKMDDATALPPQCQVDAPTPTPTPTKKIDIVLEAQFSDFYAAYPKRQSRKTAAKAYARVRGEGVSHETIMAGLIRAKRSDSRFRESQYTPLPASWLNAGGYADEPSNVVAAFPSPAPGIANIR